MTPRLIELPTTGSLAPGDDQKPDLSTPVRPDRGSECTPSPDGVEATLRWGPSILAISVAACVGTVLSGAIATGRPQLVAFAAPLIGLLVASGWHIPTARVLVSRIPGSTAEVVSRRCFENESVDLYFEVDIEARHSGLTLTAVSSSDLDIEVLPTSLSNRIGLKVIARRWGEHPIRISVTATSPSKFATGTVVVVAGSIQVYPLADAGPVSLPIKGLPDRFGTRTSGYRGSGVEFVDVRSYAPGDALRAINWPVSARTGRLHVTDRAADRSADVVAIIDTSMHAPGPATEAFDRAIRGATQVVQSALRAGDRAGVVCLGRRSRWLTAELGRRQFYRIIDAVLDFDDHCVEIDGTLAPPSAIPAGAMVIAFSTLLDTQFALALIDLHRRGHPVAVVDVLAGAPFTDSPDPMVERIWSLERRAMHRDMRTIGVDIVEWDGKRGLSESVRAVTDQLRRRSCRR